MTENALAKKMKLKAGQRAAIVNAPQNYLSELQHDAEVSKKLSGKFDWIQIFAKNQKELNALVPKAARALKPESILWLSFPKGSSKIQTDLTRDKGWDALQQVDLKWLTLVSVDDTWSAFAVRPYKPGEERQSCR